jgi:hypothetical protein
MLPILPELSREARIQLLTHGLRSRLHSCAASQLGAKGRRSSL